MIARVLATWFGSGLSPKAPGTVGTLATVPFAVALGFAPAWVLPIAALLVTALGVWSAGSLARTKGLKDPQEVVIDESAGYLWACCGGPFGWPTLLAAFVLFRLFERWESAQVDQLKSGSL